MYTIRNCHVQTNALLASYHKKRNFTKTPEPKGGKLKKSKAAIFVIHEHHASQLHYDLRLEMQGILKSWALPKGIPNELNEKHLAILTEAHPLEYANFAGTIPQGQYGGGKVKIWDKGTFENLSHNKANNSKGIVEAFNDGHILFCLYGHKIKRKSFVLQKFKADKDKKWLIFKVQNEPAE